MSLVPGYDTNGNYVGTAGISGGASDLGGLIKSAGQDLFGGAQTPGVGPNPYRSGWDSLIKQLQGRANLNGMDADQEIRNLSGQAMNHASAMSAGRSAGAAREAALATQNMQQGVNANALQARIQAKNQADAALQNALAGANGAQYNYDALNQQNAQANASRPTTFQNAMSAAGQLASGFAGAGGGAKPTGAAPAPGVPGWQGPPGGNGQVPAMPTAPGQGYSGYNNWGDGQDPISRQLAMGRGNSQPNPWGASY